MLTLAPIRYARVLSRYSGPIEQIRYRQSEVDGQYLYEATATLTPELRLSRSTNEIFGQADGTGTHQTGMIARHMAISEAIERWALYYLSQAGFRELHGFEEDATSTGMAAYPGLFDWQSRNRARMEAIERYCLVAWWEGQLGLREYPVADPSMRAWEIENPLGKESVIMTTRQCKGGYHIYGFSAARKASDAYWRAVIEMERSDGALAPFYLDNPGFEMDDIDTLANRFERRVLYFSLPEGHRNFMGRVDTSLGRRMEPREPEKLVDEKVEGPWNLYATVWRVLYRMPAKGYLSTDDEYFYW